MYLKMVEPGSKERNRGRAEKEEEEEELALVTANKETSIKSKIAVKKGGKLTHGTHRLAANVIFESGEGGMRGRGTMGAGHGG